MPGELVWVQIFERAPIAIELIGTDGKITSVNPAGRDLLGENGELVGRSILELIGEDSRPRAREIFRQALSGRAGSLECTNLRGTAVLLTLVPLVQSGSVQAVLGFAEDVGAQSMLARDLRGSEARQRLMLAHSPDLVFAQDRDLRYTFVLAGAPGLAGDVLLGKRDEDVFEQEEAFLLGRIKRGVIDTGSATERDVALTVQGQKRHYVMSLAPTRDAEGKVEGLIGYARDVTREKKAEAERERLHRQLIRTQKLESLGVLANMLAHDFNNLLVSILGNASLAQLDLPADHPAAVSIAKLIEEAQRATNLTREMLSYSVEDQVEIRPIQLTQAVRDIKHLLSTAVSRRVELAFELDEELPAIEADPAQIQQLVMNLVINGSEAIEAAKRPGKVVVRTTSRGASSEEHSEAGLITGDLYMPCKQVVLEVSDDGVGMDEETRKRILDPFFSAKGAPGRGLGLAAVRSIVRGHNGAVYVTSEPGKGSTLRAVFPTEQIVAEDVPTRSDEELRGEGIVLIVDDDAGVRATAGRTLIRYGYRVLFADSGKAAIEVYKKHSRVIRAVLLDDVMRDIDGADLLKELRKIRPDVSTVISSGGGVSEALRRVGAAGRTRFVQKPYAPALLADKLKQVLEENTKPPASAAATPTIPTSS